MKSDFRILYSIITFINVFIIMKWNVKTLTEKKYITVLMYQRLFFGQFSRIDQYMRDRKCTNRNYTNFCMGLDSDMFDDFDMSPEVMI